MRLRRKRIGLSAVYAEPPGIIGYEPQFLARGWRRAGFLFFSDDQVYDESNKSKYEHDDKPKRTTHSAGFGVSVHPDAKQYGNDQPNDRHKTQQTEAEEHPLSLSC